MSAPIRLIFHDAEDLAVASAHLQDAVVRVGDMSYAAKQRRFALVLNRFRWELPTAQSGRAFKPFERVRAGVHFDGVLGVRVQGIARDFDDAVLELLAIKFEPANDGAGVIDLIFAGGGTVRLDVECIEGQLSDITQPWATAHLPDHPTDDAPVED
jgi:hypothetical protein